MVDCCLDVCVCVCVRVCVCECVCCMGAGGCGIKENDKYF